MLGGSLGDLDCPVPDERTVHRSGSSRSWVPLVIAEIATAKTERLSSPGARHPPAAAVAVASRVLRSSPRCPKHGPQQPRIRSEGGEPCLARCVCCEQWQPQYPRQAVSKMAVMDERVLRTTPAYEAQDVPSAVQLLNSMMSDALFSFLFSEAFRNWAAALLGGIQKKHR